MSNQRKHQSTDDGHNTCDEGRATLSALAARPWRPRVEVSLAQSGCGQGQDRHRVHWQLPYEAQTLCLEAHSLSAQGLDSVSSRPPSRFICWRSEQSLRSGNQLRSAVLLADVVVRTASVCHAACAIASPDQGSWTLFSSHDRGATAAATPLVAAAHWCSRRGFGRPQRSARALSCCMHTTPEGGAGSTRFDGTPKDLV